MSAERPVVVAAALIDSGGGAGQICARLSGLAGDVLLRSRLPTTAVCSFQDGEPRLPFREEMRN